jgi:hypothetical protein
MILNRTDASDVAELQATFDLRWQADQRAIKKWQAAHPGNELVWPDHADMVVWLLEQLDAQKENPFDYNDAMLEVTIDQAVARERERCAQIAEHYSGTLRNGGAINACRSIAKAIRGTPRP